MLYEVQTIKIAISYVVWIMIKTLVQPALLRHALAYNQRGFECMLWVQQYTRMRFPHISKIDQVLQRVMYLEPVDLKAWTTRFRLVIDRQTKQSKEAI
ncbi:hypothetical protein TNCV_2223931 [Trichonephila clavipes]|nr:hypothetical protein TNCV_2223931 [Trichonephila clavipes]